MGASPQLSGRRLILASTSPRRRELLDRIGLPFTLARPDIDETPWDDEPAHLYVARMSREKAAAAARSVLQAGDQDGESSPAILIAADTTVADGPHILGKPGSSHEAYQMLASLRGREHLVHTGLSVGETGMDAVETQVVTSHIRMRAYSDAEIADYIARGEPYDKAGGYAIQDSQLRPVAHFTGCYTNIMGLPLCALCQILEGHQIQPPSTPTCTPDGDWCAFAPR